MGDPVYENKRRHIRHPLTGDLTGRIVSASTGSVIPCMAMDVSVTGLRIMLMLDLEPGTDLVLKMAGRQIGLKVMWCGKEPTKKGYFSVGLQTTSPEDDLEKLFLGDGSQPLPR